MEVVNNKRRQQFEIFIEDHKAELVYRLRKKTLFLLHTFVPKEIGKIRYRLGIGIDSASLCQGKGI